MQCIYFSAHKLPNCLIYITTGNNFLNKKYVKSLMHRLISDRHIRDTDNYKKFVELSR